MRLIFILLASFKVVFAYNHINDTDIDVFVNNIASCNLNTKTRNMICINRSFQSIIEYHEVKDITMCKSHYCIQFLDFPHKIICNGYVYLKMGGDMLTYLNPLTPNEKNTGFTGSESDVVEINHSLNGYNIQVVRYEQNVETVFDSDKFIDNISCHGHYATDVTFISSEKITFGLFGLIFHDPFTSFILGVVISSLVSFGLFLLVSIVRFGRSTFVSIIVVPTLSFICIYLILFVAEDFIVQIDTFVAGSVIGIVVGYIIRCIIDAWCSTKVAISDEEIEQSVILKDFTIEGDISDDDGNEMVEINLHEKVQEKVSI